MEGFAKDHGHRIGPGTKGLRLLITFLIEANEAGQRAGPSFLPILPQMLKLSPGRRRPVIVSPMLCILPESVLTLRAEKLPKQGPLFRGRAIISGAVLDHRYFGRQQLNRFWLPVSVVRSPTWVQ